MSAKPRRGLALLALGCLCLLPTLAVGYLCYYVNRADHPREIAAGLGQWLGLTVELQEIAYPVPGAVEYRGLVLKQPETGEPVAEFERLLASRSGAVLRAEGLTIHVARSGESETAPHPVRELLHRLQPPSETGLDGAIARLEVDFDGRRYAFPGVHLRYFAKAQGDPCFEARMALSDRAASRPLFLEIVLARSGAVSEVRLDTGEGEIPIAWLDPWLGGTAWLGPQTILRGRLSAQQTASGWILDYRGRTDQIDLERLLQGYGRNRLTGMAACDVQELRWEAGSLHSIRGQLAAGPGRVSTALLHALGGSAGFALGPQVGTDTTAEYGQLCGRFALQQGTLFVQGACSGDEENVVLRQADGQVLLRAPATPQPVLAFARALGSDPVQQAGLREDPLTRVLVAPPRRRAGVTPPPSHREHPLRRARTQPVGEP